MVGIVTFSITLLMCLAFLFSVAFRSRLLVRSDLRTISLVRSYLLGFGALGREREKTWSFSDISDIAISSTGLAKRIDIKTNHKNDLGLGFSLRALADGERFYDLLKGWVAGTPLDQPDANETLDEAVQVDECDKVLKNVERLLYFFGVISLLSGGMDLLTAWAIRKNKFDMDFDFVSTGFISFVAALVYLGSGFGTRKRAEGALWIAMVVVIFERFYDVIQGMANGVELNLSVLFGIFITLFLLNYLWGGVKEIRKRKENSAL